MNIESKTSPRHWRIEDILLYLNNNVKKTTAEKILHSILISGDILTWNPQGEIVYHGRDIPGTNIENLLQSHFYHTTLTFLNHEGSTCLQKA